MTLKSRKLTCILAYSNQMNSRLTGRLKKYLTWLVSEPSGHRVDYRNGICIMPWPFCIYNPTRFKCTNSNVLPKSPSPECLCSGEGTRKKKSGKFHT